MDPDSPHPGTAEISREALPQSHLVGEKGLSPLSAQSRWVWGQKKKRLKERDQTQDATGAEGRLRREFSLLSLLWEFSAGSSSSHSSSQGIGRDCLFPIPLPGPFPALPRDATSPGKAQEGAGGRKKSREFSPRLEFRSWEGENKLSVKFPCYTEAGGASGFHKIFKVCREFYFDWERVGFYFPSVFSCV